jgi:hypothetical protein
MKEFNTSGPNIPSQHYTITRVNLITKGLKLIEKERYFTIWAPRQTGKSTYFRQLANELEKNGYLVAHINFEDGTTAPLNTFILQFVGELNYFWKTNFSLSNIQHVFYEIEQITGKKFVLIIDEVEGINPDFLGMFLHAIRRVYHSRHKHSLKSVILVGVTNIVGVVSDNASPFNITDNLNVPYFTDEEVFELLGQHETETGQLFDKKVKQKISEITANQPGLVNGFAKVLVENNPDKKQIDYDDYLKVEDWYLTEAIDKNFANILNKSLEERAFVEKLLFTEEKISFKIDMPSIKLLFTNGLIKKDENGFVTFWVPFYKKRLYTAFYPYTNGEKDEISLTHIPSDFYENNKFNIGKLIAHYKIYVKRRGFKPFFEKDENGKPKSIKESALIYSFETFITAIVQELSGRIYREADTGLGKSDMIINIDNQEYLIETKIYSGVKRFETGKTQLAYYADSLQVKKAIYLVYLAKRARIPETIKEQTEQIDTTEVTTYLVGYDDTKW